VANENTVSIEYSADGSAAIATAQSIVTEQGAAMDRVAKVTRDATAGMASTWRQFVAERMGEYMRLEGSHGAAMKRMSEEWQAYKASGARAVAQVETATIGYLDRVTNQARTTSATMATVNKAHHDAVQKLIDQSSKYELAGVKASQSVAKAMDSQTATVDRLTAKIRSLVAEAAGIFGAFKLLESGKDATMFAANVEMAERALGVVGNATGRTVAQMARYRDGLKDVNITSMAATSTIAMMARAELDLEQAVPLARLSQGAARMASLTGETISSSEALNRLIRGIITLQPEILNTLGITVTLESAMRDYKQTTGKSAESLSQQQKVQLLFNAALVNGRPLLDLYVKSMDLAAAKISSSARPVEELKLAFGQLFLPELTAGATAFYGTVSGGMRLVREHTAELEAAKMMIKVFSEGLLYGAAILGVYSAAIVVATAMTGGLAAGAGIFSGVLATMTMQLSLTGAAAVVTSAKVGLMGESVMASSTVATAGLMSVKVAMGVLSAFVIGWEFGKMLNAQFQSVRDFGTEVVWGLAVAWHSLVVIWQAGAAVLGNLFDPAAMGQALEQIEVQRIAWQKTWDETRAEQLRENAVGPVAAAAAAPRGDDKAAIQAALQAKKERLRQEQEMQDRAAATAAEKERKRQADITATLVGIRERDLMIGKEKNDRELIQLDMKHQKEINSLLSHKATRAQLDEAYRLQKKERNDLFDDMVVEKAYAIAAAEAQIAQKNFQEQAAWLDKLDAYKLKTGQISEEQALGNRYERQRQILTLQQQGLDIDRAHEKDQVKRNALQAESLRLQLQINGSKVEEANETALLLAKEEDLAFAHAMQMEAIRRTGEEATLHFLGQEQGALAAHYAWKQEELDRQYAYDLGSLTLSTTQKLAKEREYLQRSLQLSIDKSQKQRELDRAEYYAKASYAQTAFANMASAADIFYALSGQKSRAAFRAYQIMKSGETVISTASAAMKAFDDGAKTSYWLGLAYAAATVLYGGAQLAQIWSASPDSSSSSVNSAASAGVSASISGGSGAGASGAQGTQAAPAPIYNVHLYGINFGVDEDKLARAIYPAMRRAANDGVR